MPRPPEPIDKHAKFIETSFNVLTGVSSNYYLDPLPVKTKNDFVKRYERGEFGNRSPTWPTYLDWFGSGYKGLMHIRNRVAGGPTWYNMSETDMMIWRESYEESEANLYFSAMCPTERTLFQGEVYRSNQHLSLFYSTIAKPMRESLKEGGKQVYGIVAATLLRHYLDQSSYEWLDYLLTNYEDHVVEFTTLDCKWGAVPGFNTLFWEVRMY